MMKGRHSQGIFGRQDDPLYQEYFGLINTFYIDMCILERRLFFLSAAESMSDVQKGPPLWKCLEREGLPPLYSIKITDKRKLLFEPQVTQEADYSTPNRIKKIKIVKITGSFK